jgi:hypothetical protein
MRHWWLLACLMLAGCKLIDQKTFAPSPEAAPASPATGVTAGPREDTRVPLVVIDYATPDPAYQDLLRLAVRAAEGRSQSVQYDVVAMIKNPDESAVAQQRAASVMRAIMAERVPAARVHLALRTDPALAADEVRVYVR